MDIDHLKKLMILCEGRDLTNPDIQYVDDPNGDKVIAILRSYKSQSYTKLAQKIARIEQLEDEIKQLKNEVKTETKENIHDLFDAEDAVRTRVVETLNFIFHLTKDPKATETPKYKEILNELEKQLTPELITVLEGLKKTMKTVTQKSPALTIKPIEKIDESFIGNFFAKLKSVIYNWANKYDSKLNRLKSLAKS